MDWKRHRCARNRVRGIGVWTGLWILAGGLLTGSVGAQRAARPVAAKIAWHGTWKGGLAEARRTGRPIMLVSAAPQCHAVPGVW